MIDYRSFIFDSCYYPNSEYVHSDVDGRHVSLIGYVDSLSADDATAIFPRRRHSDGE